MKKLGEFLAKIAFWGVVAAVVYLAYSGVGEGNDRAAVPLVWASGFFLSSWLASIGSPPEPDDVPQIAKDEIVVPENVRSLLALSWIPLVLGLLTMPATKFGWSAGVGVAAFIYLREIASRRFYRFDEASWAAYFYGDSKHDFSIGLGGGD